VNGLKKKQIRHKAENKLVTLAVVWIVIVAILCISLLTNHQHLPTWATVVLGAVIIVPLVAPVALAYNYWKTIVSAIEITEQQFPDIYKIFREAAADIGVKELPRLYMSNGNGVMNAYATKGGLKKKWIMLYSDLVDIYSELDQEHAAMLRFVISHELGHIYLGHVNIRRMVLSAALRIILLEKSFSRAQEYSADRVAASVNPQGTYADALFPLYIGKRQFQHATLREYLANDARHISRFWVAIVNFFADHPVGRRRLAALAQMDAEGWENVHGKML